MKSKSILYIHLSILILFTSCSDWFDVNPKSQVKAEKMFENEAGFRDALVGVYTIMARTATYGGHQTMGFMDAIGQVYSDVPNTWEELLSYDYTSYTTYIDNLWKSNYNAIVNCNYILHYIDEDKGIFSEGVYEMVKGEALALRAFLHFDLLRSFAPSYLTGADDAAIPYVDYISKSPFPQSTVREVLKKIIDDIEEARELIKDFDPIGP